MAGSVNKVILVGNAGKDPQIRRFQNGGMVAEFSVATSETWRDKQSGEKKERTEWHNVSVLNEALAKVVEQYLKKGNKVYVEGQLETQKYQGKDGTDRYTTKVVIRPYGGELHILTWAEDGGSGGSRGGGQSGGYDGEAYGGRQSKPQGGGATAGGGGRTDMDDDIPFSMEWR